MSNYRDPKVTDARDGKSSVGKWIGIIVAIILVLLLLAWLLGWFATTDEVVTEPAGTTTEETVTPPANEPAAE